MIEKPDFEKMLQKSAFKCHPLDTEPNAVMLSKVEYLLDELWSTYISPLYSRIKELEAENEELRKKGEWISVNERLPKIGQEVWINTEYYRANGTYLGSDQYGIKFREGMQFPRYNFVTHWQPLPSKPENKLKQN